MFWALFGGIASVIVGLAYAAWADSRSSYNEGSNAWIGIVIAILGAIAVLIGGIASADRAGQHATCKSFGRATNYPVKFYIYAGGWAYTCYAKVDNTWIPKDQVREFLNH